jgi:purine catabolism regulator
VAVIVIEGKIGGYLSILGKADDLDGLDNLAAERGALVCAVELAKQRAVEAAEQQLRGDFLDVLLTTGNTERRAVARQAAEIGYELNREHAVVLFGITGNTSRTWGLVASEFRARLLNTGVQLFLCSYEQDLVALCGAEDANLLKNLEQHVRVTHDLVLQADPNAHIPVGLGRPGTGLVGLRTSFAQALEALTLARDIFGGDRILPVGALGLYHLLCRLQDSDEMVQFYEQTLAPLVAYDTDHNSQLVHTLEAFFAHHGNVSQTAESLFLHRNSLLYRLERIGEISGLDLDDPDNRFSLQLALKLYPLLLSRSMQETDDA